MTVQPAVALTGTAARVCVLPPSAVRRMKDGQAAQRTLASASLMTTVATLTDSHVLTGCAVARNSGNGELYAIVVAIAIMDMFDVFYVLRPIYHNQCSSGSFSGALTGVHDRSKTRLWLSLHVV